MSTIPTGLAENTTIPEGVVVLGRREAGDGKPFRLTLARADAGPQPTRRVVVLGHTAGRGKWSVWFEDDTRAPRIVWQAEYDSPTRTMREGLNAVLRDGPP